MLPLYKYMFIHKLIDERMEGWALPGCDDDCPKCGQRQLTLTLSCTEIIHVFVLHAIDLPTSGVKEVVFHTGHCLGTRFTRCLHPWTFGGEGEGGFSRVRIVVLEFCSGMMRMRMRMISMWVENRRANGRTWLRLRISYFGKSGWTPVADRIE